MNKAKLTAMCHKIAREKGITFNTALTYYFLESILGKIAVSDYKRNFIFKGGFLLSNIIGLESRTTSDMDFIIEQLEMDKEVLVDILQKILIDDLILYHIGKISDIKDDDPYGGYRISIICQLENIRQTIPLGDPITPKSVNYSYKSLFAETRYPILAYNTETILVEKIETMYRRSFFNSRSKDFYDIYILYTLDSSRLNFERLKQACINTFDYRKTPFDL